MSSDVTLSSFIISLDIVHPNFDILTFSDFVKANYKKDFIVINATDFVDQVGGRSSRSDARGEKKPKVDNSTSISKGIKSKIDQELSKLIDSKKRHLAQQEKAKGKESKKNKHTSEQQILFDGQIEAVFCIINFPYTALQLKALEDACVDLGAFIAIRSPVITTQLSDAMLQHKNNDKSARATAKRSQIEGSDMDSTVNIGVFPPLRWNQLKPNAKIDLVFDSLITGETHEEAFDALQKEIGKIIRGRNKFKETFENRVFKLIPPSKLNLNLEIFKKFLQKNPGNIYDAIYYYLFKNGYLQPPAVQPPETSNDKIQNMFQKLLRDVSRKYVANPVKPDNDDFLGPIVTYPSLPSIFDTVYKLITWEPVEERGLAERAVINFYANNDQYYCAAGHQFESLAMQMNKKYQLGLPSAFFDWSNWCYFKEHPDVMDHLEDALQGALVVGSVMEESVGILWVLTMSPVAKQIGWTRKQLFYPMVIDGISEWFENVFEKPEVVEKKTRGAEKIADQIRNNKLSSILPPINARLDKQNEPIYILPVANSDTIALSTPYLFSGGLRINVLRDIVNGRPTFRVKTMIDPSLEFITDTITSTVAEREYKVMFGPTEEMTVFSDTFSARLTKDKLVLTAINESNIVICANGDIVFVRNGEKFAITSEAFIGRLKEDGWHWTERNGMTYTAKNGQKLQCNNDRIMPIVNMYTKIKKYVRRDNLDVEEHDDGTLIVKFAQNFVIRHSQGTSYFTLPGFPDITLKSGIFSFSFMEVSFVGGTSGKFSATSDKFSANYENSSANFVVNESIINVANGVVQAKCKEEILYTSKEGIERFGTIQQPDEQVNRKLEPIKSIWGNVVPMKDAQPDQRLLDLHKVFCPRFFAIRPDFSATEFIHKSQIPAEGFKQYDGEERFSLDERYNIVTLHKDNEIPHFYFKQEVPDKQSRFSILKTLTIPKPKPQRPSTSSSRKKKQNEVVEDPMDILDEAENNRLAFTESRKNLGMFMENIVNIREEKFMDEIHPIEPPPEPQPPQPPLTPSPALLIAQMQKSSKKPNEGLNFWDSPECLFAAPQEQKRVEPKVEDARMHMHDLVTPEMSPEKDAPPETESARKSPDKVKMASPLPRTSPSTPQTSTRMYRTEVSRPQTATGQHSADFMTIHVGDVALQTVKIQNMSSDQMKYSFSQPTHPDITILTVPGVLASGLSLTIKIRFTARKVEKVRASFTIVTNQGNIPIICSATVIQ